MKYVPTFDVDNDEGNNSWGEHRLVRAAHARLRTTVDGRRRPVGMRAWWLLAFARFAGAAPDLLFHALSRIAGAGSERFRG